MGVTDDLLERHRNNVAPRRSPTPLEARPALPVAIVTCMDARIDTGRMMGSREGDVHVIRNAGATVTDDVTRSLAISQVVLGTREVMLVKHTDCGLQRFQEDELRIRIADATGAEPWFRMGTFRDLDEAVRPDARRKRLSS